MENEVNDDNNEVVNNEVDSNGNGKKLFKSIYNEDPLQFKTDFNDIVRSKVLDKIQDIKQDIINSTNKESDNEI